MRSSREPPNLPPCKPQARIQQCLPGWALGLLRAGGLWHTCTTRKRLASKRCGQLACRSILHQQLAYNIYLAPVAGGFGAP